MRPWPWFASACTLILVAAGVWLPDPRSPRSGVRSPVTVDLARAGLPPASRAWRRATSLAAAFRAGLGGRPEDVAAGAARRGRPGRPARGRCRRRRAPRLSRWAEEHDRRSGGTTTASAPRRHG